LRADTFMPGGAGVIREHEGFDRPPPACALSPLSARAGRCDTSGSRRGPDRTAARIGTPPDCFLPASGPTDTAPPAIPAPPRACLPPVSRHSRHPPTRDVPPPCLAAPGTDRGRALDRRPDNA